MSILAHAAKRDNCTIFEYLMERGADIVIRDELPRPMLVAMLQRRQEWIDQATLLAHQWHLPLIAIRTIHEYVIGFNWSVVLDGINTHLALVK